MRQADEEFVKNIVNWIFDPDRPRPAEALVACDTKAFSDWVMRQVQHPTAAKRVHENRLEGEDGTRIAFRVPTGREICGRSYDKIFLVDNLPWRIYAALIPCEQPRRPS